MRDLRAVLVTGGAGFVGTALVRRLLKEPNLGEIVLFDNLSSADGGSRLHHFQQDPRVSFFEGDVTDPQSLDSVMSAHSFDGLFHLAVNRDLATCLHTNVDGMRMVLALARKHEVPVLRTSEASVFGNLDSPDKAKDDHGFKPSDELAVSHASADLLCLAAFRSYAQDVIVTRSTENYGPYPNSENLIAKFVKNAQAGESLAMPGRGLQIRDWLHVDDHCRGLIAAMKRGKRGGVFHFSGRCERTRLGMGRSVLEQLRLPKELLLATPEVRNLDQRQALDDEMSLMWFGWQPELIFADEFPNVVRSLVAE